MIDGVPVQCDSAEAALALVRLHGGDMPPGNGTSRRGYGQTHLQAHNTRWTDERIAEFYKLIEGRQRKLVDTLLENVDARTDAQLIQLLNLSSGMALAGVFAGLYKNAKKVGADPKELYFKKSITIGDKRGAEYTLSPGFRQAAARRVATK